MEARKRSLADNSCNISGSGNRRRSSFFERRSEMDPTVHLLDYELYLASIPKESLSSATHSLLEILLKLFQEDSACRRNHFFSFTATATDFSVILDGELLKVIQPAVSSLAIRVSKCKWRALVVEVGAMGSLTGVSSIVASVIAPLANCGVSVFCVSTNLDDFVLVRDSSLQKALSCLARRFTIMCDSQRTMDVALVSSVMQKTTGFDSPKRKQSVIPNVEESPSRPITHPYFCSTSRYSVCGIVPKALPSVGTALLQLMLFNHRSSAAEETFLSFSIVEDDISIMLDCRDLVSLPADSLYLNDETWRMIRIGEGPLGFDECGIVAQVSAPLAKAAISTYYICTFDTDHTLVRERNAETALQLLNERYEATLLKMKASRPSSNMGTTNSAAPDMRVPSLCTVSYITHTAAPPPPPPPPATSANCDSDLQDTAATYSTISSDTDLHTSLTPFTDSKMCAMAT